ncbi:hypothetical protein V8F06_011745, partial [Rhypophila decipiens]
MAPLIGGSFVRHIIYPLSLIRGGSNDSAYNGNRASSVAAAVSSSNYSRLHSADEDEDITIKPDADGEPIAIDPPLFFVSPFQLWAGRLVSRVNKSDGVLDDRWLPKFPSRGSASLRKIFSTFPKPRYGSGSSSGPWTFVFQFEVGAFIWHPVPPSTMDSSSSSHHASLRAPGHGMLGSTIFAKALRLSASARVDHPPAKIINLSSVDVAFLSHYVARLHDIWSAPMQILAIACLAVSIMGWPALAGFVAMAALFVVQGRAGIWMRDATRAYVSLNDTRLDAVRDLVTNFKAVKALAVESVYRELISDARAGQLKALRRYLTAAFSIFTAINQTIPGVVASTAFLVYWAAGNELSAQVVFPSLAYFNLLSQPVFQASLALSRQFSVKPSLSRISNLLYADELERIQFSPPEETFDAFERPGQFPAAVMFHNATVAYPSHHGNQDSQDEDTIVASDSASMDVDKTKADEESYFLQDMSSAPSGFGLRVGDLGIPSGRLTAIIGPTGSGKTSLLLSILGELSAVSGHITLHGDVSYAAQEPMILSGTFKDNITLGGRITSGGGHGQSRYRDVLQRTGLDIDLSGCPGGPENAVIGESGSNLSGGQRARVGLARALYSDAEILLLDDPLAAVDARVRNKLFDAFREESRTVVLATLHTQYATKADYIVVLDENQVVWLGDREAFMANQSLGSKYLPGAHASDRVPGDRIKFEKSQIHDPANNSNGATSAVHEEAVGLVEDEERAKGALKWKVLAFYTTAAGGTFQALSVLTMAALLMGARIMGQYWFVWWIDDSAGLAQSTYLGVYLALVVAQSTLIAALGLVLVSGSNRASRAVHDRIVENLLSAPLAYFQSQPTGRILNRLGRDIGSVDSSIMNAVDGLVAAGTTLLSSLVLIAATGSFMFATVVPFLVVVGHYLQRFRVCAREIQRTASLLSSPVLSILSESLSAPATIHAYAGTAIPFLQAKHAAALDTLMSANLVRRSLDTWVTLRAEGAAAMVLALVAIPTAYGVIPETLAGMALGLATTLAKNVYLLAWSATDLEIQMNSAERLMVYHDEMPREGPMPGEGRRTPSGWPFKTDLVLDNIYVQYKSRAEPVLKGDQSQDLRWPKTGHRRTALLMNRILSNRIRIESNRIESNRTPSRIEFG